MDTPNTRDAATTARKPLPPAIDQGFRRLDRAARAQATVIACINSLMEFLMADNTDLTNEIASLRQAVVDDQTADDAIVANLNQVIADLKAGADTQPAIDALEEIKTQLKPAGGTGTTPSAASGSRASKQ